MFYTILNLLLLGLSTYLIVDAKLKIRRREKEQAATSEEIQRRMRAEREEEEQERRMSVNGVSELRPFTNAIRRAVVEHAPPPPPPPPPPMARPPIHMPFPPPIPRPGLREEATLRLPRTYELIPGASQRETEVPLVRSEDEYNYIRFETIMRDAWRMIEALEGEGKDTTSYRKRYKETVERARNKLQKPKEKKKREQGSINFRKV